MTDAAQAGHEGTGESEIHATEVRAHGAVDHQRAFQPRVLLEHVRDQVAERLALRVHECGQGGHLAS